MANEPKKKVATKKTAAKKAVAVEAATVKAVTKKAATKKVAVKKTAAVKKAAPVRKPAKAAAQPATAKATTVVARCDVGFGNTVFIRGEGKGLSWEVGIPLSNNGRDEWVWTSTEIVVDTPFKLLLNDETWAEGENCIAIPGTTVEITPRF